MIVARIVSWSSFDISCKAEANISFWHDPVARHRAEESLASGAVHKMVEPCCQVGASQLDNFQTDPACSLFAGWLLAL